MILSHRVENDICLVTIVGDIDYAGGDELKKYMDSLLEEARGLFPLKVYNYCLIDNQVHLLVEPTTEGSLSKAMEYITREYAKYFNKTHDHFGHLFHGRFKSFLVQPERFFFACSRYIDLYPV